MQNRPIAEQINQMQLKELNAIMAQIDKKEAWGYIWDAEKVTSLEIYNNFDPGFPAQFMYLNGYMFGINMSNIPLEPRKVLMDAPFQNFKADDNYIQRFEGFIEQHKINYIIEF